MKTICKITIIFMLLLPAVAQANAIEPETIRSVLTVEEESIDSSFKKNRFSNKRNNNIST